ncbi:MAG: nucleoside deaminase [Phycisphaeraceae bacterium]|nr:nucleoside deaminase [Phycisphaeraceae bacterium]MCW5761749.1 nucleoside deaminase [Phycisphaeraceae bacterium]
MTSHHDKSMMHEALRLARIAASLGEVPVGAVVYHTATGTPVAHAFNRRERDRDPAAHAEFLAVQRACRVIGDWRLNEYSIAITLEPCAMCAGMLVNARVGRVVFGALDPKAGAVRSLHHLLEDPRLNHRAEVIEGLGADESAALLRSFFRSLRAQEPDA